MLAPLSANGNPNANANPSSSLVGNPIARFTRYLDHLKYVVEYISEQNRADVSNLLPIIKRIDADALLTDANRLDILNQAWQLLYSGAAPYALPDKYSGACDVIRYISALPLLSAIPASSASPASPQAIQASLVAHDDPVLKCKMTPIWVQCR